MAWHSTAVIPREGDDFSVKITFNEGIPAIYVAEDVRLQFMPGEAEFAVRYLNDLADKARALALQVAEAKS